jgi:phospholipid transport system substrate-binding protein
LNTTIPRAEGEAKILYRMHRVEGTWKVYDVIIEGVSIVQNYRSQFGKILLNKTPAHLIEMLKKKVEQKKKG